MNKIKNLSLLICAGLVLIAGPLFLTRDEPIEVEMPRLSQENIVQKEEQQKKEQEELAKQAKQAKEHKIYTCQEDDDCIVVDKDPCGCLVGPQGITAINALYTLEFNRTQSKTITKACPDIPASQIEACNPSVKAVCRAKTCTVVF